MILNTKLFGRTYQFKGLYDVWLKLMKKNQEINQQVLQQESAEERIAAKVVLSHIKLEDIRNNPAVAYEEDEVTRIIQDAVNEKVYEEIKIGQSLNLENGYWIQILQVLI